MSNDTKESIRIQAKKSLLKRRIDAIQQQQEVLDSKHTPVFLKITTKCVDAEKRLIAFITKSLSLDLFFDFAAFI
jgi:hypothetical protein